ncbi:hypothetical protein [Streptomyces sp. NPDC127190]|uniref:hypothetical protein n=1 Tax=unclassified Streptomyces TaxID=2593676 RepID=UPI0036451248
MTSTTDTAGHPDVAAISELAEGLLPPERAADLRRHLDDCALCADVQVSLEEIRGLLGSVPVPDRMPDDVALRIDAALAAEAAQAVETAQAPGSAEADEAAHVSRETSLAPDRPAGRPHAATGPGRKGHDRARRRRRLALGAVLTVAALGAGSLVIQSLGGHSSHSTAHDQAPPPAVAFSGSSVHHQVDSLLATEKNPDAANSPRSRKGTETEQNVPGSTASAHTLLGTNTAVPECVKQAILPDKDVLGAKTGSYAGKSAYLVVVPDTADSRQVTAYVVDAACVGRQPGSTGTVLLKQSFPRP